MPLTPLKKEEATSKQNSLDLNKTARALDLYCKDLTSEAKHGKLDPVIGRESEIKAIIKVLSRRGKTIQCLLVRLVLVRQQLQNY